MKANESLFTLPKYNLQINLGELKSMLIARDCETQVKAASDLLKTLNDEVASQSTTLSDFILNEDTISFLCEAMATTNCALLQILVSILHVLSLSEEMVKQRDSLCVAEAALRAAHFLAPLTSGSDGSQPADIVHASTLRLLAVIIRRWTSLRKGRPVSEVCRPEQLIVCVRNIYTSNNNSDHDHSSGEGSVTGSGLLSPPIVLLAAADALAALVAAIADKTRAPHVANTNINFTDSQSLLMVTTLALDVIQQQDGQDALDMQCKLTEAAIKYSTLLSESKNEAGSKEDTQDSKAFGFFKDVVERFMNNVLGTEKYRAYHRTPCVVSVLAVSMEAPISRPMRLVLAHRLARQGFLILPPEVMDEPDNTERIMERAGAGHSTVFDTDTLAHIFFSNVSFSNDDERNRNSPRVTSQNCGLRLVVSILTALASDLLPESPFFEAQKLAAAASALPNNVNEWGRLIASQNSWAEMRAFVLLWAYCLCLCCVSLQSIKGLILTVLPHLTCYLTTFPMSHLKSLSQAWVKIIWLVFAVLSLSASSNESNECRIESASERLMTILVSKESLQYVYSHNPALLYWVFSIDSPKLQCQVIALWLELEDSAIALGDLVRTRRDAAFRVLDVIQTSSDVITTRGAALLEMALTSAETETAGNRDHPEEMKLCIAERFHLAATIWSILPTVLSRSTQTELGPLRCNLFLALAYRAALVVSGSDGDSCKDMIAAEKVCGGCEVRTACHLATLLASFTDTTNPPPLFQLNGLLVARLLLQFTQHRIDPRVFSVFSVPNALLKVLVSSIISTTVQEPLIVLSSLRLLTTLQKCQKFFVFSPGENVAVIPANEVLKLLETCGQMVSAIVEMVLAHLELRCCSDQPLLELDNTTSSFWRALFLRLQMLCTKDIPDVSLPAWNCMTILLSSNICDLAVKRHLATQPWTHLLLRTVLDSGPSQLATVLQPQRTDSTAKTPSQEIIQFILAWLRATSKVEHRFRNFPTPYMLTETCCLLGTAIVRWTAEQGHCSTTETLIAQELVTCGATLPPEAVLGLRKAMSLPQHVSN